MNTNQQAFLSPEQTALVTDFTNSYGLEAEDIIFFTGDPKPFFSYEATCVLCNKLTDTASIEIEPIPTSFIDSLSLRCRLTLSDGHIRSAVGVANINETDGRERLSEQQLYQLASARAIRNALRTAGIDLVRLHRNAASGTSDNSAPAKSNFATLLARAHVLGVEAGVISADDDRSLNKIGWRKLLWARYGTHHSNELSEEQLADFVAALASLVQQQSTKKAA